MTKETEKTTNPEKEMKEMLFDKLKALMPWRDAVFAGSWGGKGP